MMRRLQLFLLSFGLLATLLPGASLAAGGAGQVTILQTGSVLGNVEPCRS